MKIQIFDVEHGSCALVTADTGRRILIDAGHNGSTNWRPSTYLRNLGVGHIEQLIITNFDEDHASDLQNVLRAVSIGTFYRNRSVGGDGIKKLKRHCGMGPGIEALVTMEKGYQTPVTDPPDFGAVSIQYLRNNCPEFDEENNLSLVVILKCHGLTICFPGDMEVAGWKGVLRNRAFVQAIEEVNVFVASHHGRKNGCCEELFDQTALRPQVIIISDSGIEHTTQETVSWYRARAIGMQYNGQERRVFTTRMMGAS